MKQTLCPGCESRLQDGRKWSFSCGTQAVPKDGVVKPGLYRTSKCYVLQIKQLKRAVAQLEHELAGAQIILNYARRNRGD